MGNAALKISPMRELPILFNGPMVRAILDGRKTQTRRIIKRLRAIPRHDVHSDFAELIPGVPLSVDARWTYDVELNPQGAVAARLGAGKILGLKPGEFDFLCPYADGHTYLRKYQDGRPSKWTIQTRGDRLWVRETWGLHGYHDDTDWCRDSLVGASDSYLGSWSLDYRADWGPNEEACFWRPSILMPRWASRLTLEVTDVRVERLQDITNEDAEAEGVGYAETGCDGECGWTPCSHARAGFERLWNETYKKREQRWLRGEKEISPWVWVVSFRRLP